MTATALILAAGKGTRMRSALAKVLHPLAGRPMVHWVLTAVQGAGCTPVVVVGHQRDQVISALPSDTVTVVQDPQEGTGHAVQMASGALPRQGTLLVVCGDTPLLQPETLQALLHGHGNGLCTVLTASIPVEQAASSGYGRIVRDADGNPVRIVETANATAEERLITEINTGVYAFDARWLLEDVVPHLQSHPPKGERYLTDAVEAAALAGGLRAVHHHDVTETMGINDRAALAQAEQALRARINHRWMMSGVTMQDPATTYVDAEVRLAQDVRLGPGVVLRGTTHVATGASIGPHSVLIDTRVEPGATVLAGTHSEGAVIGPGARVGPMARLRPGTQLGRGVRIGNFVETKKAVLHEGATAGHLAYLGDCEIGRDVNIGAGTITCNYDGYGKHRTEIGDDVFIGSNTALVAPVRIGRGAIVGAGSTITLNVPDQTLAVARGRQKNLTGRAPEIRARLKLLAETKKNAGE
jgi:bifunctional UDP-N-acetylglucosamine pyrophosphorylase/glucosamine-1-phosphate N-acetyltransferase